MPITQTTQQDLAFITLENDAVSITVIPEQGAKIASLVDKSTGREWMWSPPEGAVYGPLHTGMPFPESSKVGADEVLPTIEPCHWRGRDLPDHGEVFTEAWELDLAALESGVIATSLRTPVSPLFFERSISLQGNRVQMKYRLSNSSDEPYEYIWAFHGLLTIKEGDRIELPTDCQKVRLEASQNCGLGRRGSEWNWLDPLPGVQPSLLELGSHPAACAKLFTEPLSEGRCAVVNEKTGDKLVYEFDAAINNTVGIWINRGAWEGYHHFALEPSNGAPDPLDVAVRDWKRHGSLEAGESREWGLDILLG